MLGYALTPLTTIEGMASGYTLIFQDLTEMKKLESELRLKDRMAAVGELSAGIAHEIRNPLAAIAGSVQVLKKSSALSDQEQRLMSIILKESDRHQPLFLIGKGAGFLQHLHGSGDGGERVANLMGDAG